LQTFITIEKSYLLHTLVTVGDYFLDKKYFLEESDYLNGKLPCAN